MEGKGVSEIDNLLHLKLEKKLIIRTLSRIGFQLAGIINLLEFLCVKLCIIVPFIKMNSSRNNLQAERTEIIP